MFSSTNQCALRIAAGAGLLLLLTIHQRAGDKAFAAPTDLPVEQPADRAPDDERQKPEPLTLANTLPDPVPPRWLGDDSVEATEAPEELAAAAWTAEPANSRSTARAPSVASVAWWSLWRQIAGAEFAPTRLPQIASDDAAAGRRTVFQTSILRTGPPRA